MEINENTLPHDGQKYKRELMDLIRRIDFVLSDVGIGYFGVFGTCLGAVRDGGIIPWDDDIDIAVRREDYRRAIEVLSSSDENLFVYNASFRSARIFNRIAQDDTIERRRAYIDLYVIDYAPKSTLHFYWNVLWYVGLERIIGRRKGVVGRSHPILYAVADVLALPFRVLPDVYINKLACWFYVYTAKSSCVKLSYDANRKRYPNNFFLVSKRVKFNDMAIAVPEAYDEYLTMCYGDWRTPPKPEDRVSHAFDGTGTIWAVKCPAYEERAAR